MLVLALTLLALLTGLVLAVASVVQIETKGSTNVAHAARARAQALAALEIAVGQLQRYAGPDARVTMCAGPSAENPAWTGVWDAGATDGPPLVWLVNGNELDPRAVLPGQVIADPGSTSVWLWSRPVPSARARERVKLPLSEVRAPVAGWGSDRLVGRFAYWVGDEGVKLGVNDDAAETGPVGANYPWPELRRVFASVPNAAVRTRILLLDQALEAGFPQATFLALRPDLAVSSWGVRDDGNPPRLVPAAFNVNSHAPAIVWQALLAPAEVALPAAVRDSTAARAAFYETLHEALEQSPRPVGDLAAFRAAVAGAFPAEADQDDYWARMEPVLSTRSDSFLIRTYGDVTNPADGSREAAAWLEARVQRGTIRHEDARFGRRFEVRHVRWLAPDDV